MELKHVGGSICYWTGDHAHMIFLSDDVITGTVMEEYVSDMANCISICNEDRHIDSKNVGHGRKHTNDEIRAGALYAAQQLTTKTIADFKAEMVELDRKIALFKMWGKKQPPEAVLFYDQDMQEILMTVGRNGQPAFQRLKNPILRGFVPTPEQAGAKRDKHGIGWTTPRHLKGATKLGRMR
tara:strand:+ start:102 stop:647 length:546 start_codon:yes stop_codon:yes gene_type:complete